MHLRTFHILWAVTSWVATCLVAHSAELATCDSHHNDRPNIIFILADDLGWTDLQVGENGPNVLNGVNYGSTYYQTPNLARLARSGVSFTHCYAQPNCAPTRAAILSGQYAPRKGNGVYHVLSLNRAAKNSQPTKLLPPKQRQDVPAEHPIYPELLKQAGYRTCHIGKYHVGGKEGGEATLPKNQGFDFNYGGTDKGGPRNYFAQRQKFSASISPSLDPFALDYTSEYLANNFGSRDNQNQFSILENTAKHVEDALGDAAIHFLKNHISQEPEKPFYMQLHHFAVHSPIGNKHARKDLLQKYNAKKPSKYHKSVAYGAILENLDQTVGRLLDFLDDPNTDGDTSDSIRKRTIVVFASDNGGIHPSDNNPLRHVKGSFFEGGIRVPLIVSHPDTVDSNSQSDTLIHCVDFYPTFLQAAGIERPANLVLDGESFLNVTTNFAAVRNRKSICYHFPGYLDRRARPCSVVVRRLDGKDYKLIYNYDFEYTGKPTKDDYIREGLKHLESPWELYCLTDDLDESNNLLDNDITSKSRIVANGLARELSEWLAQKDETWHPKYAVDRETKKTVKFPSEFRF